MKRSKFTEAQIAFALRQSETGTGQADVTECDKKSCEACLQKGNGLFDGQQLSGICPAGVSMCMPFQVDVLLYPLPTSAG